MKLTLGEINEVFEQLLKSEISRDEADRWAWKHIQSFDSNSLELHPKKDEEKLWEALQYLHGIDLETVPGEFLHSNADLKQTYEEKWKI